MDVVFVIYVGIGCGAGWATSYENKPAVLLGLENVAECGWSDPSTLKGMIAHEMGHLVQDYWRNEKGISEGSGPWWQLYTEGFAQRCEQVVTGQESWHMGVEEGWERWCQENTGWLTQEFLKTADGQESVRPFFGSWYEIEGKSQTGYFLGCEVVKRLEERMNLQEIALLSNWDEVVRLEVESLSGVFK